MLDTKSSLTAVACIAACLAASSGCDDCLGVNCKPPSDCFNYSQCDPSDAAVMQICEGTHELRWGECCSCEACLYRIERCPEGQVCVSQEGEPVCAASSTGPTADIRRGEVLLEEQR